MSDTVIQVENLGKLYRIGRAQQRYTTLRDSLANAAKRFRVETSERSDADTIWALKEVSFEVKQGERLGIIGRNGAGKSTLLKILSRITEPTTGRVRLRGRVASLLEVGTGFHPELTGRENIYLNGAILGMRRAEIGRKFDEIVAFAEVEKFLDTPVKRYSSGMYVRLAFAVAAHLEPEILVVDEVLAVGDAAFQKKSLGKMQDISGSGRTILFVSHNIPAILNLCNQTMWINEGCLMRFGETSSVVHEYIHSSKDTAALVLESRTDRIGEGQFRFQEMWVTNRHGELIDTVMSGDDVVFHLQYRVMPEQILHNVDVSIIVCDLYGQRLFVLGTRIQGFQLNDLSGSGYLHCYVPALPLMPDTYVFHLWSGVNGVTNDALEAVMKLTVNEADVYHAGVRMNKTIHGTFWLPHSWDRSSERNYLPQ